MNRINKLPFLLLLVTTIIFYTSCKKDNGTIEEPGVAGDSLLVIKTNLTEKDTLQSIIKDAETGQDIFFYGKRNADGLISSYTAMVMRNRQKPDTALNILFDDSARIRTYYYSVSGVNDTSLYMVGYPKGEDSLLISRYYINWTSGERVLRKQAGMKRSNNKYNVGQVVSFRTLQGVPSDDKAALEELLSKITVIGGAVLVLGAGIAGSGICGPTCGLIAALTVFNILFDDISTANASELPPGVPFNINGQQVFVTTVQDVLLSTTWKIASRTSGGQSELEPCELDNTMVFGANGTLTEYVNANRCDPLEPATYNYHWEVYNNGQSIKISPEGEAPIQFSITRINPGLLELAGYDESGSYVTYKFIPG